MLQPTLDRILLRDISSLVTKTEGGIILPDQVVDRQKYRQWEIVRVGPLVQEAALQPGLEVITSGRFAGEPFDLHGETCRFVSEEQVIAILTTEE